jgi:dTDP-4-dehydrorhamnose reductase
MGATGLIGSYIFRYLSSNTRHSVFGSIRSPVDIGYFPDRYRPHLHPNINVENIAEVSNIFEKVNPEIVINCIGLTKHIPESFDPIRMIELNAMWPHRLAKLCSDYAAKLIHISTDCVFSGKKGNYLELDLPDSSDLYGRTKILGEVDYGGHLTLRTSTIGHELHTKYGLLEWFLAQERECLGFSRAIFSGLPSVVFAEVIRDFVLLNPQLRGLYQVSADPINKYDLLKLIANIYGKKIEIKQDHEFTIDRSLNCEKFKEATGYTPAAWPNLIETMYKNYKADTHYV